MGVRRPARCELLHLVPTPSIADVRSPSRPPVTNAYIGLRYVHCAHSVSHTRPVHDASLPRPVLYLRACLVVPSSGHSNTTIVQIPWLPGPADGMTVRRSGGPAVRIRVANGNKINTFAKRGGQCVRRKQRMPCTQQLWGTEAHAWRRAGEIDRCRSRRSARCRCRIARYSASRSGRRSPTYQILTCC